MFCIKKPELHAKGKEQPLDFAWMTYIGVVEFGYSEWEVNHMSAGKWSDLMYHYKKRHNMRNNRVPVKIIEKQGSLLDL